MDGGGRTLVGRDEELAAVRGALAAAAQGRPTIALLLGEPGIGKSRLADEAAVMARTMGLEVLHGEADPSGHAPMELWRGVHRSLGLEPSRDPSLPAEEQRWDYLESLADALAARAPTLVVLEDVHWADESAMWVLEHLPRALGDSPVAFVASSRDHEPGMPPLDALCRVSRVVALEGLDVDAVGLLAAGVSSRPVDAEQLHRRTGGNPLFVLELVRAPHGSGVIGEVLARSLDRFDTDTRELLATAASAGSGTPLTVLAQACSCPVDAVVERFRWAREEGVLDEVTAAGVRFHHALLADAAKRYGDRRARHARLASAWDAVGGVHGRASACGHRLRSVAGTDCVDDTVAQACTVAAELVAVGLQARAASLLWDAREVGAEHVDRIELRARVALDLAEVLSWLGDFTRALILYEEAADLARGCPDPVIRARAEVGANLWATAFVPDLPRMRRLEGALEALPGDELHLRATLLGRLALVGGADPDATGHVKAWTGEAVAIARTIDDPVLTAQLLVDQMIGASSREEVDAGIALAADVVRLAERAGRSDLALVGHQRGAGFHLNAGDLAAANRSLGRAEVLAAVLPSPAWRQTTLITRTTLLALRGSRSAAEAAMYEAVRVGEGHVEPVVVLGCEWIHQLMLLDLFGHAEPRAEELYRITSEMLADVPSPVFQVQKGFAAQLFGDESDLQDVLHRYGPDPGRLLRSMTGDSLLRVFADLVARAGARTYAGPVFRALLPYAGLLNVGGGHSAGLPVDDVLGRLALLDGDVPAALRHARAAVALARAMPSPPLLVHCLDHLAEAIERTGDDLDDPGELRAEADAVAATCGVVRPGGRPASPAATSGSVRSASMRRDGAIWALASPLGEVRLARTNGLDQLARLLSNPGVEVSATELAGQADGPGHGDLGPGLDARAKREYRRRLIRLQAEVDDAGAANDPVRGERAHVEMDALLRELKRAVGLGGRDRPSGSDAERARINVVRSLRRAIAAIADQAPLLGAHLDGAVRTGGRCIYLPDPSAGLSWRVSEERFVPSQ
ncbi:AAA family ATPase [Pseudonocardia charpentierae]|uniref:AAA family ATPase n=1 Tax=Pseudonocardia charpentierae TaxID=3075545 RepID=A0ABU2NJ84_9PSEU|nr:AAA family ATPase [Pseudonocardia sp. DSM 45834]MDT0354030.1 AAA family ATPase [Pseudonocardia sp. DSM 45834]